MALILEEERNKSSEKSEQIIVKPAGPAEVPKPNIQPQPPKDMDKELILEDLKAHFDSLTWYLDNEKDKMSYQMKNDFQGIKREVEIMIKRTKYPQYYY